MGLKGARFTTTEDIETNATAKVRKILKEASIPPVLPTDGASVFASKGSSLKVIR
jgi:hypothetical protein